MGMNFFDFTDNCRQVKYFTLFFDLNQSRFKFTRLANILLKVCYFSGIGTKLRA